METSLRNGMHRFRGFLVKGYLQLHGCSVGRNFKCVGFPVFRCVPKANFKIGDNVSIGCGVVFEITPEGRLQLDDYALIGDYCTISSAQFIHLKKWCAIAERVSLRDTFHRMEAGTNYREQESSGKPIVLEEDSGAGAGTVILKGVRLPKGTFIGANAVVSEHDELEEMGIYGGNPLKLVRKR